MICNARVLRDDFLPSEVVHRDPEINRLSDALQPITAGRSGEPTMLFGPSGAGKSCIARFTCDRLQERVLDVDVGHVNCWQHHSAHDCAYHVLDEIGHAVDVHKSTPETAILDRLQDRDRQAVVILDEVDQLDDKRLLYDFYATRYLTMILIANDENAFLSQFDDRLRSRLQVTPRIHFDAYDHAELVAIVEDRVDWGLDGTVEQAAVDAIADHAAGDARKAIAILRTAAQRADQHDERLTPDLVDAVVPDAEAELRTKNLSKLTRDQRILYEIVTDAGTIQPGDLQAEYRARVEDPMTDRSIRRNLKKLAHYNLVAIEGEKRGRTYRAPDHADPLQ